MRRLLDVRPAEEVTTSGTSRIWLPRPGGSRTALAWTPDGRALVFVGQREGAPMLYVRELHRGVARPLAGTDGARALAVSPDGQWVAFWADGAVKRIPFGGGPVATLVEGVPYPPTGIAIGAGGDLLYSGPDLSIWRASAGLGPAPVTKRLEAEVAHLHPVLLPAERALLYTVRRREWTWGDEEIVAQVLATGERKVLLRDAVDGRYVPGGHLVFLRRGTLFAVGFVPGRLEVRGSPVALLDRVAQSITGSSSGDITGPGQFSVAPTVRALGAHRAGGGALRYRLIHTGQHYDARMSGDFFVQLGIPEPAVNLEVGSGTQAEQVGAIMQRYEALLTRASADLCLVVR